MKITLFSKMLMLSGAIQIIMAIVVGFSLYAFFLTKKTSDLSQMETIILKSGQMRLEMLVRRDSSFFELYENNRLNILANLREIDSIADNTGKDNRINELLKTRHEYENAINEYVNQIALLGLNENDGLEGRMRSKIHKIEQLSTKYNLPYIKVDVLQVRRREKDFIMRNRFEYLDSVKVEMNRVVEGIRNSAINTTNKNEMLLLADGYLEVFNEFVNVTNNLSRLEMKMNSIELEFQQMIRELVVNESKSVNDLQSMLVFIFFLSLLITFILPILIARTITKPIKVLKEATLQIADGKMETKVNLKTRDEIGEFAEFFNKMVSRLNESNKTILEQQDILNNQFLELQQVNITKDKFFSIIAHDLKNPISSFVSVSDFLVGKFNDLSKDEIKEFLDEVHLSAKNVYELLENLLLWSRSQRGLIHFHPMNLDLNTIILNNVNLLEINAEMKEIKLKYIMKENFQVFADPNMLNTVMRNLITNAIKFTPNKGTITVQAKYSNECFCIVSITDTGIGIEESKIGKLFQLEHSYTTNGTNNEKGTGLGLILCKEFLELHQGKIWVESTINQGSTFSFTIPLINETCSIIHRQTEKNFN